MFRGIAAVLSWLGLLLQFWLATKNADGPALTRAILAYVNDFIILGNLACAVSLTFPALATAMVLRTAALLWLGLGAALRVLAAGDGWAGQGLQQAADVLLIGVTPVLYFVDWLVFTPKRGLAWWSPLVLTLGPLAYGAWVLAYGARTGEYPYAVLDVGRMGLYPVLLNMAGLALLFLAGGLVLVAISQLVDRLVRPRVRV